MTSDDYNIACISIGKAFALSIIPNSKEIVASSFMLDSETCSHCDPTLSEYQRAATH